MSTPAIPNPDHADLPRANFARRLGPIVYDLLAVTAVLMLAAGIGLGFAALLVATNLISLSEGADHASLLEGNWLFRLYLLAVIFWFYGAFWVRGGQTIGMRAWRIKVQNTDGSCISWKQAAIRFVTAVFGLSNIRALFSKDRLGWQDKAARCEVIVLSAEANKLRNWRKFR